MSHIFDYPSKVCYNHHVAKLTPSESFRKADKLGLGLLAVSVIAGVASGFSVLDHYVGFEVLPGDIDPVHIQDTPALPLSQAWSEEDWTFRRYVSTVGYYAILAAGLSRYADQKTSARAFSLLAGGSGFLFAWDELLGALDHASAANVTQWGGATTAALAGTAFRARTIYKSIKGS